MRRTTLRRAGADNGLGPIHVRVAPLELGLQLHPKTREVDQFPAAEQHGAIGGALMLDADDEVPGVVIDFVRRALRLKIERPEAARFAAFGEELRVEVEDATGGLVEKAQVGI